MASKIFISLLLAFVICEIVNGHSIRDGLSQSPVISEIQEKLAKIVSLGVVQRLLERSSNEYGIRVPVLPQLPDPYMLDDTTIVEIPLEGIDAEIYLCNSSIIGLSKITDDIRVLPEGPALRITYALKTETITTQGLQTTKLNISDSQFNFASGFGGYELSLVNGSVNIALLFEFNIVTEEVHLSDLSIDMTFENLRFNFDDATLNNKPVDWDPINEGIQNTFEQIWPILKPILEGYIMETFEELFKNCTPSDIISLDFSCIGTKTNSEVLLEAELLKVFEIRASDACPAQVDPSTTTQDDTSQTTPDSPTTTEPGGTTTAGSERFNLNLLSLVGLFIIVCQKL